MEEGLRKIVACLDGGGILGPIQVYGDARIVFCARPLVKFRADKGAITEDGWLLGIFLDPTTPENRKRASLARSPWFFPPPGVEIILTLGSIAPRRLDSRLACTARCLWLLVRAPWLRCGEHKVV
jgi:hypothetical protein